MELPEGEDGWEELLLWESAPDTTVARSEIGKRSDRRELKHRAKGETRVASCPLQLTKLLDDRLRNSGTDTEGFLFQGVREVGQLSESAYSRA